MDSKKIILMVVCLAVIIAGVWLLVRRMGGATLDVPREVVEQPIPKIDTKTGKEFSFSPQQWEKYGKNAEGYYMNPETKEFTMAPGMSCAHCYAKIPGPIINMPTDHFPTPPEAKEINHAWLTYKCPKCGELANPQIPIVAFSHHEGWRKGYEDAK